MSTPYTKSVNCAICGIRKPRRHCPGVAGDICAVCCGTGREETVDCPLTCEYLVAAHRHERIEPLDPADVPNSRIDVPEEFVREHMWLLVLLGSTLVESAFGLPRMTDYDLREGIETLVQMYRVRESGLYYETVPANPYAAAVVDAVQTCVADLRKQAAAAGDPTVLTDAKILNMILFLQRLEYAHNNGRKLSRAFLDALLRLDADAEAVEADNIAEPDEPRIIL